MAISAPCLMVLGDLHCSKSLSSLFYFNMKIELIVR